MVLVSSSKRSIDGISCRLEHTVGCAEKVERRKKQAAPLRIGAEITSVGMHYKIKPNPLFNDVRMQLPGANGFIEGYVEADSAVNSAGQVVTGTWAIDMPDTGFFFPGDVMHYYFSAWDNIGGAEPYESTLPADTSGYSEFSDPLAYAAKPTEVDDYVVHFLPTILSQTIGDHPRVLWWNDWGHRGGQASWYYALLNNGYLEGVDFDTYYTNAPTTGFVANGLGGRATPAAIENYDIILYTSGNAWVQTICNNEAGDDIGLLHAWIQQPQDRYMFLAGNDLASDLEVSGATTQDFLDNWIGADWQASELVDLINNQSAPTVRAAASNPVFTTVEEWIAYGSCPAFRYFDAVEAVEGVSERIAEFLNPQDQAGQYTFAAATYAEHDANHKVVYLPYDLIHVHTLPGNSGLSARAKILRDVLQVFGSTGGSPPVSAPAPGVFAVKSYPNPFNPQTKIEFTLPQRGHVTVKIFNVRGELVRTLVDGVRAANVAHVETWNGTDDRGAAVSSGVYFYEVKTAGQTKVNKLALVR